MLKIANNLPNQGQPGCQALPVGAVGRCGVAIAQALLLLSLLATVGCQGHARVRIISTNLSRVSLLEANTSVLTLDSDRCVHWIDQAGRLNIGLSIQQGSILGRAHSRELFISFVLDKPTAGVGRDYRANRDTLRGYYREGPKAYRFRSLYGAVAIENRSNQQLAGAFRIRLSLRASQWLGSWSRSLPFLIFGTFQATPDRADRGRTIRQKTEVEGWTREVELLVPAPPLEQEQPTITAPIVSSQPTFLKRPATASQPEKP